MNVIARIGIKVPMEGKPRSYISDSVVVTVADDSHYYLRRIAEGDLLARSANNSGVKNDV